MTDAEASADQELVDADRRKFLTAATSATAAVGVVFAASPFIASWQPSERARALGAPVTVDLSKLEAGQMIMPVWRRQPIYVFRRPPELVAQLAAHDARLKDPKSLDSEQPAYAMNERRSRRDDIAVLIGVCTHLGCLPKQRFEPGDAQLGTDWPGGFLCPCHGSRFDLAGRVFNGSPASVNLRIPPYSFPTENTLVIGEDGTNAASGAA
ncbi:MAG TPA: ubiquinol-cytochrome c reductase iron-sulfur subunit [Steroidobacteraceae bacterium]|nr:ubiquinol-cytochrome c reductase iron-sulfur subunit [Steroidobacteraceae bacterium]